MSDTTKAFSALNHLDPSCPREEWIKIGMSVKSAGLSFEDFHSWSKNGCNYVSEKDCYAAWKSFDEQGGITEATLFYMAQREGWQNNSTTSAQPVNVEESNYALSIWDRCIAAEISHNYIFRKKGEVDGLRVYPLSAPPLIIDGRDVTGYLVVPCYSNNKIQTLQFIPPNEGKKLNLPGASFNDGYFTVGPKTSVFYICEGIGQAWAAYQASGYTAIACFGSARMPIVTEALKRQYSDVHLILVPDRGKEAQIEKLASSQGVKFIKLPPDKPNNYDINDYAQEYDYDELANLLADTKAPNTHYKLLSGEDLLKATPMRWMVQGLIPEQGFVALYGQSGTGKSFLVLDLALAIAADEKYWFGLRVTQSPVTYICLEGESGLSKRIKAWNKYFEKPIPDALRFIIQPFNVLSDDVSALASAIIIERRTHGLVIIDTLNRAAPGADENSSVDMGRIITASKQLQNLIGGVVMLVHHTGKDSTRGLRGHSSLYAALDSAIEVTKNDTRREWSVAKSKDDITGDSNPFMLEIVPLGNDEHGDEITSCVALFDGSKNILQKKPQLGRNQKIALAEIDKLLMHSQHEGKDNVPSESKCIPYEEALSAVAACIPTGAKHRKSRATEAISGLVTKQILNYKDDWVWKIN